MSRTIKFRALDKEHPERGMFDLLTQYNIEGYFNNSRFILMQFTGILDRHGKEIYDGDLIENDYGRICEVAWHKYTGQWDAKPINSKGKPVGFLADQWRDFVTVIGSIYEHPDLLK